MLAHLYLQLRNWIIKVEMKQKLTTTQQTTKSENGKLENGEVKRGSGFRSERK